MITITKDAFTVDGITFGIPAGCVGLVDEDNERYAIVHPQGDTLDQWTAKELMEDTLGGEFSYGGIRSAAVFFLAGQIDDTQVNFNDPDTRQDFGGELYAAIAELENYADNADDYAYDVYPDKEYASADRLAYYWFDCHDDAEFYNYALVCRVANVSAANGTYALGGEFLLPQEDAADELQYLLSQVTVDGKTFIAADEL